MKKSYLKIIFNTSQVYHTLVVHNEDVHPTIRRTIGKTRINHLYWNSVSYFWRFAWAGVALGAHPCRSHWSWHSPTPPAKLTHVAATDPDVLPRPQPSSLAVRGLPLPTSVGSVISCRPSTNIRVRFLWQSIHHTHGIISWIFITATLIKYTKWTL